jgi:hypothetical protein
MAKINDRTSSKMPFLGDAVKILVRNAAVTTAERRESMQLQWSQPPLTKPLRLADITATWHCDLKTRSNIREKPLPLGGYLTFPTAHRGAMSVHPLFYYLSFLFIDDGLARI